MPKGKSKCPIHGQLGDQTRAHRIIGGRVVVKKRCLRCWIAARRVRPEPQK